MPFQDWVETDFRLTLTKRQPISWSVNDGLSALPLNSIPGQGNPPQFNEGNIPPAPEIPFTGELICIEVDISTELPSDRNDYKGEATIVKTIRADIDANKYNAIGIKAIEGRQTDPRASSTSVARMRSTACSTTRSIRRASVAARTSSPLNHFFDGANVVTHDNEVRARWNRN